MRLVWTPQALDDRDAISAYIAAGNPRAAAKMDALFDAQALKLLANPRIGPPGVALGTRELMPHKSNRLIFTVDDETISILTIISTARQRPPAQS